MGVGGIETSNVFEAGLILPVAKWIVHPVSGDSAALVGSRKTTADGGVLNPASSIDCGLIRLSRGAGACGGGDLDPGCNVEALGAGCCRVCEPLERLPATRDEVQILVGDSQLERAIKMLIPHFPVRFDELLGLDCVLRLEKLCVCGQMEHGGIVFGRFECCTKLRNAR